MRVPWGVLGLAATTLAILGTVVAMPVPVAHPGRIGDVLFPSGDRVHITDFSPLVTLAVAGAGVRLAGAATVDHTVLLMAWSNGTPLPLCPDFLGYVGTPWNLSLDLPLNPGVYQFGPVCGGLANFTVTSAVELLYPA